MRMKFIQKDRTHKNTPHTGRRGLEFRVRVGVRVRVRCKCSVRVRVGVRIRGLGLECYG